ncbi:uncharacterized protein LOC110855345 [Folsomia candida]|uniref:uncharacterized protein LOC110855345 n=1 Tax=Folsomia candida TaxID=158441 RepID=UPI000B9000D1|nr:uncharacterized protein LOC110855345 [Folsomia candida]XP_035711943.1 uncharacterized protein LOC110855345 [Folsomia candida]
MGKCCEGGYRAKAKILAIIQMMCYTVAFLFIAWWLLSDIISWGEYDTLDKLTWPIVIMVFVLFGEFLAVWLYLGVKQGNKTKCKIWFWIHTIYLVGTVITVPVLVGTTGKADNLGGDIGGIFAQVYFLLVVYKAMEEIDEDNALPRLEVTGMRDRP